MGNSERNAYVRHEIIRSTVELLTERNLESISISEICGRAQVSRNSFYRNFGTKEDVLKAAIVELTEEWNARAGRNPKPSEAEMLADIFGYLSHHGAFYELIWQRGLLYLLRDVLYDTMGPKPDQPNKVAYTLAFMFSGIFGWIEEWFRRGMQESPEEMEALLRQGDEP